MRGKNAYRIHMLDLAGHSHFFGLFGLSAGMCSKQQITVAQSTKMAD
ncbi:hypothetical protein [Candidatus Pelagisphaera phototrophica]|nr:hypothetical protein [Candidatus Pelagisphaera phototrophica]QXD31111.1 hypothetical protein GA004_12280 [Candidatus Pelagisphaera phototrophica]